MRKKVSVILKILLCVSSLGGVSLSLIYASTDGFFHWTRRVMYFTAQSNIWLGLTTLIILLSPLFNTKEKWTKRFYLLRYVFTVSISMTGLVFCLLLAPFADSSYHVWSVNNIMTHVTSPLLAVSDYFIDERRTRLSKKQVFLSVVPPILYFSFVSVLYFLQFDFGRGETYPYFFINYRSPAGVFGFSSEMPFIIGSFYWFALFSLVVIGLGFFYGRFKVEENKK